MSARSHRTLLAMAVVTALGAPSVANAVRLDDDGLGQALIYPYYTVQSNGGDSYNTYLSVVNHTTVAKAVRVRVREGRASREVASFNLFLSANDVWTGAIVPGATPSAAPRLVTADTSCTTPVFDGAASRTLPASLTFSNALYSGANDDGNGTGIDRAREGFVEMIEMADVTGASAVAVSHRSNGIPANCAAVQGSSTISVAAPMGGLSGTLTLINVANGLNFDQDAVALADLSKQPFYRPPGDPYPDFNALEVDPMSVVVAHGALYRLNWTRSVDAVSAVLMRNAFSGEYVLDDATASNTDFVATFPTRSFYVGPAVTAPPFTAASLWAADCRRGEGENVTITILDRETTGTQVDSGGFDNVGQSPDDYCAASVVFDVSNGSAHTAPSAASHVLGSLTRGYSRLSLPIIPGFSNGWLDVAFIDRNSLAGITSLANSTRLDLATGAQTTGPEVLRGLPVIGFTARTFVNGTLACDAGACQGNYGGAFPFQYRRSITP
jgi:hypothetical protein